MARKSMFLKQSETVEINIFKLFDFNFIRNSNKNEIDVSFSLSIFVNFLYSFYSSSLKISIKFSGLSNFSYIIFELMLA